MINHHNAQFPRIFAPMVFRAVWSAPMRNVPRSRGGDWLLPPQCLLISSGVVSAKRSEITVCSTYLSSIRGSGFSQSHCNSLPWLSSLSPHFLPPPSFFCALFALPVVQSSIWVTHNIKESSIRTSTLQSSWACVMLPPQPVWATLWSQQFETKAHEGNLRWQAPTAPSTLAGVQQAFSAPPQCYQGASGPSPSNPEDPQSEDCLFLR